MGKLLLIGNIGLVFTCFELCVCVLAFSVPFVIPLGSEGVERGFSISLFYVLKLCFVWLRARFDPSFLLVSPVISLYCSDIIAAGGGSDLPPGLPGLPTSLPIQPHQDHQD